VKKAFKNTTLINRTVLLVIMKSIVKIRAILSLLLIITFVIVTFTGIGLYLSPSGRIARETSWGLFGLGRWQLENMHTILGFIMSALIIIHLAVNYKLLLSEVKVLVGK